MRSLKITFLLLACGAMLGACGLKGPLYLPTEDGQAAPASQVPDDDDLTVTQKKDKQSDPG